MERELAEEPELTLHQDNVWTFMHPTVENATKQHIQTSTTPVVLTAAIEIQHKEGQHTSANKSLFASYNLQIISGLTAMIQTLAPEESISREETLMYLSIISMMLYNLEK